MTGKQVVIDMSETIDAINSQNEILVGILNKPAGIDVWNQGNENLSMNALKLTNQGRIGGDGWSNA